MTSYSIEIIRKFVLDAINERLDSASIFLPSKYWLDFARNFRYVYDLGETELDRIRYHTYHLTSDCYLTYYFASEQYRTLLINGFKYFADGNNLDMFKEGDDGIGVDVEFGKISHDLIRYLGVASDLINSGLLDSNSNKYIIEIGGGYGGLARIHLGYNTEISYFICDLEETIFFSAIYLTRHLGQERVHLLDHPIAEDSIEPGHVYIVPQARLKLLNSLKFSYAISQQSIQEMTLIQVERYASWLTKHSMFFYSCNVSDHGDIARSKDLVLNLPMVLSAFFSKPVWTGDEPLGHERFGDNHLIRAIYRCAP